MKEEPEVLFEELLERAKAGEPKAQTEVILCGFVQSYLLLIPKIALPAAKLLSLPQLNCVCLDAKLFKKR